MPGLILPAGASGGGGGTTPPLDYITWEVAYWVDGPAFLAEGYSDTDAVDVWPDEIGANDMTQGTGSAQPQYDAVNSDTNNLACVHFATNDYMDTVSSLPSPGSMVGIVHQPNANDDVAAETGGGGSYWRTGSGFPGMSLSWGGGGRSANFTQPTFFMYAFYGTNDTGNEKLYVDGTLRINTNAGSDVFGTVRIGGTGFYSPVDLDVCFWAFYDGDVTADSGWGDFKQWVQDTYGITQA